jgi:hypothetical protein
MTFDMTTEKCEENMKATVKKTRKVKADYAVLEDTGEGTFKLVSTAKSLKAAKARLVAEKLSGEFLLVTIRGRVKATVVEQLKLKAV